MQMKKFILTQELREKLLQYLSNRPYLEVHQGINALYNLEEYKDPQEDKKDGK